MFVCYSFYVTCLLPEHNEILSASSGFYRRSLRCSRLASVIYRDINMGKGYRQRVRPRVRSLRKGRRSYHSNGHTVTPQKGQEGEQYCFNAKTCLAKLHHSPFAPTAPLNTTSYIISAKARHANSPSPELSFPDFDIYGSMEGLLGIREASGDSGPFCKKKHVAGDGSGSGLLSSSSSSRIGSSFLSLRIHRRDDQIAHLEVESLMLRERLICMEEELDVLKQRVRILELSNEMGVLDVHSGDASCA